MRVDDLIRVCKDLAKSQGFYGRLLAQLVVKKLFNQISLVNIVKGV